MGRKLGWLDERTKRLKMEEFLKKSLNFKTVKGTNQFGFGGISQGQTFVVDDNRKIFVKQNSDSVAKVMLDGEFASLKAIAETNTVKVPKPISVLQNEKGKTMLVMEHLELKHCSNQGELGTQLARLHLHNIERGKNCHPDYVNQFGFHVKTSCGSIPQTNSWKDDWVEYYSDKLQEQVDMLPNDSDVNKLWPKLKEKMGEFFQGLDIKPSLLHGDLWSGNAGQVGSTPVIYDASSFYGHHEYDLAIAGMFGGFSSAFYSSYHQLIPKEPGFDKRHSLYTLFHTFNHWNHFGGGYKSSSINI